MKRIIHATFLLVLFGECAVAGGGVNGTLAYGPLTPQSVPTLSEWMLITIGLLLGVISFISLKKKTTGTLPNILGLTVAFGLIAGGNYQIIENAFATGVTSLNNPNGQNDIVVYRNIYNSYSNDTLVNQTIKSIVYPPLPQVNCPNPAAVNPGPECTVNLVLAPGETCDINCVED